MFKLEDLKNWLTILIPLKCILRFYRTVCRFTFFFFFFFSTFWTQLYPYNCDASVNKFVRNTIKMFGATVKAKLWIIIYAHKVNLNMRFSLFSVYLFPMDDISIICFRKITSLPTKLTGVKSTPWPVSATLFAKISTLTATILSLITILLQGITVTPYI